MSSETGRVREAEYWQDRLVAPSRWCRGGGMTLASWAFCILPRAIRTSLPSPLLWPQAHSPTVSVPHQSYLPLLSCSAPPCALAAVLVIMLLHGVYPAHWSLKIIHGSASVSHFGLFFLQSNTSAMSISVTLTTFLFPFSSVLLWTAFLW